MTEKPEKDFHLVIRKSGLYILAGKLVTPVITFLLTIYIVRHLTVEQYGIYNILFAIMAYMGLFSSMGLVHIFKRFLPEFFEKKQFSLLRKSVNYGLMLRFCMTMLLLGIIVIFASQTGKLLRIEGYFDYFKIFALGILFFLEAQLLGITLVSLFLHKYFVISQVIYTMVRAVLLVVLMESGYELKGLLVGEVIAFSVLVIMQAIFYKLKFLKKHSVGKTTEIPFKRLARYGGFCYFNEMGEQILDVSTDLFIISAFLGTVQAGLYAFANEVMRLLSRWMPHRLLMDVITPSFFTRYTRTNSEIELGKMFNLILKSIAFLFLPLVAGLFVLGDKMIEILFDKKYLDALHVLWIVAGFTALNSFSFPLGLVVEAKEKVEIHLYSKIFSIYNIIGNLLVVNSFGIKGIAVVTSTAILFKNVYTYFYARRWVRFSVDFKALGKIGVNALIMVLAVYFMRPHVSGLVSLVLVVIGGSLVYFGAASLNKVFSGDERDILNRIIPGSWFRF